MFNFIRDIVARVESWIFGLIAAIVVFIFSMLFGVEVVIPGFNEPTATPTAIVEPTETATATNTPYNGTVPDIAATFTMTPTDTAPVVTATERPTKTPKPKPTRNPHNTPEPTETAPTSPLATPRDDG